MSTPRVYDEMERRSRRAALVAARGLEEAQMRGPDGLRFDLILDILAGRKSEEHHTLTAWRVDGVLKDECGLCGLNFRDEVHHRISERVAP